MAVVKWAIIAARVTAMMMAMMMPAITTAGTVTIVTTMTTDAVTSTDATAAQDPPPTAYTMHDAPQESLPTSLAKRRTSQFAANLGKSTTRRL